MIDMFGNEMNVQEEPEKPHIEKKQGSIYSRATSLGVSPYLIAKKDLFYRIMRSAESGKVNCSRCRNSQVVKWTNDRERLGCEQIGISNNPDARVNKNGTCHEAKLKRGKG